jgi:hypothetical protein
MIIQKRDDFHRGKTYMSTAVPLDLMPPRMPTHLLPSTEGWMFVKGVSPGPPARAAREASSGIEAGAAIARETLTAMAMKVVNISRGLDLQWSKDSMGAV